MQLKMTLLHMGDQFDRTSSTNLNQNGNNHIGNTDNAVGTTHRDPARTNHGQGNYESVLLDKLQDMVPIMPRGRELTKLEIINYVIDYIRQLKEMVVEEEQR